MQFLFLNHLVFLFVALIFMDYVHVWVCVKWEVGSEEKLVTLSFKRIFSSCRVGVHCMDFTVLIFYSAHSIVKSLVGG